MNLDGGMRLLWRVPLYQSTKPEELLIFEVDEGLAEDDEFYFNS
jgi:hypothetical protein